MNTNIKKLVESLFDDDIDDILKGMIYNYCFKTT